MNKSKAGKPQQKPVRTARKNVQLHEDVEPHPLAAALHIMSPCSIHYMQALRTPFNLIEPVCVPDLHAVPSKKARIIKRGVFQTSGTTGVGWLIANPLIAANNSVCIIGTTSAYTGTIDTNISGASTGVADFVLSKSPYEFSQFGANGIQSRTVGVGLRIRYTGPELYLGGQVIAIRIPDNANVANAVQGLYDFSQSKTFPVSREWITLTWKPVKPSEFEYASSIPAAYPLVFGVSGTAGTANLSAPFEFEFITHIEYIGAVDAITRSHSNVVDMSRIRNTEMGQHDATMHPHKQMVKSLLEVGRDVLSSASPMIRQSVQQSAAHTFMTGLRRAGTSALRYLSNVPATIERGAMSTLRRTFSGGLLGTLEEAAPLLML